MPYTTTELIIYQTLWFIIGYLLSITISIWYYYYTRWVDSDSIDPWRKKKNWEAAVECWFFDSYFLAKKCSLHPAPSGELPRLRSILHFKYNLCSLLHEPVPGFSCHLQDTASPCDWGLVSQIFLREVVGYISWGAQKTIKTVLVRPIWRENCDI